MTLLLSLFFTFAQAAVPATQNLNVEITDVRSKSGSILVSIFNDSDAFPRNSEKAVVKLKLSVSEAANFSVPDLPPGDYAIAVAHDENENGKVDMNFLGIPKEGFGFSQNSRVVFGPPSFEKAKVTLSEESAATSTKIKVKYF